MQRPQIKDTPSTEVKEEVSSTDTRPKQEQRETPNQREELFDFIMVVEDEDEVKKTVEKEVNVQQNNAPRLLVTGNHSVVLEKTLYFVWVDSSISEYPQNKRIVTKTFLNNITMFQAKSSQEGIKIIDSLLKKLEELKRKDQNYENNCGFRIMTNRARKELNKNGVEVFNNRAGEEFILECQKNEKIPSTTLYKLFHSATPFEEGEAFALFYPEYLSHGSDYFKGTYGYGGFWSRLFGKTTCSFLSYKPNFKNENPLDIFSKAKQNYIDEISNVLQYKLRSSPDFQLEILEVKHIYNEKLLHKHRELYYEYAEKLRKETLDENNQRKRDGLPLLESSRIPQHLIAFHGTREANLESFFEHGFLEEKQGQLDPGWFGKGFYLTTYPQYAIHYIKVADINPKTRFNIMPVGETRKIIAGYVIPGKKHKITDLKKLGQTKEEGYDSHMARVRIQFDKKYQREDFFPIFNQSEEMADEIIIFKPAQYLPCFEITLKRTK
jgi:hypothetical protein